MFSEVNPISRTVVNSHLRYTFANRLGITNKIAFKTLDSGKNAGTSTNVSKPIKPLCKILRLPDLCHVLTVSYWLHFVKSMPFRSEGQ